MRKVSGCYVAINIEPDVVYANEDGMSRLKNNISCISGVTDVYELLGIYDLMVKIRGNSEEDLKLLVASQIKSLDGVSSALMHFIADQYNP